mgnify:CR=1 FL=1
MAVRTRTGRGEGPGDDDLPARNRDRLPPLTGLRAFEAVARRASMRKAADDLSVCHTVVSRHVRNLEGWFGTRLVETGPRGIRLTEDGLRLYAAVGHAFDTIAAATSAIRPSGIGRSLRLWCVPGLAAQWLTARIADLEASLPGVEIVLRATLDRPDFSRHEADAEITYGEGIPRGGRTQLIERSRLFPVASPSWLGEHGPIDTPEGLARARLIHEASHDQWRRWFDLIRHRPANALEGPRLWYASSALDAAVAGQGVALATRLQAADYLRDGRLVEILDTSVGLGDYWLVAPEERWNDPSLVRLRRWLDLAVSATQGGESKSWN